VVVEDELRLRKDPKPSHDRLATASIGERILHWAGLQDGGERALLTLRQGSHGYPLNAFVTSATEEALGLVDGAILDTDIAVTVVKSLVAVIVAAYDAETFLIWEPGEKRKDGPVATLAP
jgi:hypothetical protein